MNSTNANWKDIARLREMIQTAEAIIIGAGAGLSTSAGFSYSGRRFKENFPDFIAKYGFSDMYSAGFYSLRNLRGTLGLLEPVYFYQSLSKSTKTSVSKPISSGTEQGLLRADNKCRPLFSESWI